MVYLDASAEYNLLTLIISSIIQCLWLTNAIGIALTGAIVFFMLLSKLKYRFAELIHLLRLNKGAGWIQVTLTYNDLVLLIKNLRPLINSLIGIIYLSAPFIIGKVTLSAYLVSILLT